MKYIILHLSLIFTLFFHLVFLFNSMCNRQGEPATVSSKITDNSKILSKSQFYDCTKKIPKTIPGLIVKGERKKEHVIRNMVEFKCWVEYQYNLRRLKYPVLKGTFSLRLWPESNGEINKIEIINSTVNDSVFMQQIYRSALEIEFDFLRASGEETEVIYPIKLGK